MKKIPLFIVLISLILGLHGCIQTEIKQDPQNTASKLTDKQSTKNKTARLPQRLFLQQITSHSVIIKWRGNEKSACIYDQNSQPRCATAIRTAGNHHEVLFNNLEGNKKYLYSIDGYSDDRLYFRTAPVTGNTPQDTKLRLWILGDSGTASAVGHSGNMPHAEDAKAVMDGFLAYNSRQKNDRLDMILLLGDNAYMEGTDQQWQTAVFDLYRPLLLRTGLWPTIGNHEMGVATLEVPGRGTFTNGGVSSSSDPNSYYSLEDSTPRRMPYLDIFSLPTRAEAGGIASGTEQYYAFDYGNVHVISLDSQLSARHDVQRQAMRNWLISDLENNRQDWTIVIFHHPPYTRGSHNSDTAIASRFGIDQPIIDMREKFTSVFEEYGVDMVYSGHSHSYERSYYLNGHRGDADSFEAKKHAELNTQGQPATGRGDQHYQQISPSSGLDDKVIYSVAGSAGKVALGEGNLDHPAHAIQPKDSDHRHGLAELGSVLLEVSRHRLTALFIDDQGQVLDEVSITR